MDNKPTITEKILERIETTTPHSRTYFTLRNAGMWLLAAVSIVVGALAVGSILFRAANVGMALGPGGPRVGSLVRLVPVVWVALVAGFGYLAYREVRATRKGYKYELSTILLTMVLTSMVLGVTFYVTGAGFRLDRLAGRYVPFHTPLERIQEDGWLRPEHGFLVGVISEEAEEGDALLVDPAGVLWQVTFAPAVSEAEIAALAEGERVGMRGKTLDATLHRFIACEVRSLEFAGRGMMGLAERRMLSMGERKLMALRTTECEDVRPRD